jgi:hypothetical protein
MENKKWKTLDAVKQFELSPTIVLYRERYLSLGSRIKHAYGHG